MLGIASKWHVARQDPCMDKESEGDFSSGFVLVCFQTLKPSSDQPKADHPAWNKVTLISDRPEKILTIKEVGWR